MLQELPLRLQLRMWTAMVIIIPSLLIMAIYTLDRIAAAKQEQLELVNQRIDFEKYIIEEWITERARDVREISRLEAFKALNKPRMEYNLSTLQHENKEFDSLSYISKDGIFELSTLAGGIHYQSVLGQPYYKAAVQGEEYISDVVIGRNSGLPIINFSSPVLDHSGEFQGLILGSVSTATLDALLFKQRFGKTGEILLVNREGKMIAKPHYPGEQSQGGEISCSENAFTTIRLGEDGNASWVDYLNNQVLGAYRYLPERGWTLIGKINEEEVLAPVYEQLRIMAISTMLFIVLLLPLAVRLIEPLKRPIEWLIRQSLLVSAGQYAIVGQDRYTGKIPYELKLLCQAFTSMSGRIEANVKLIEEKLSEIQNMNTALEKEIAERRIVQAALVELNEGLESEVNIRTSKLQKSEENYRALVENSPDVIARFDDQFRLIYGNAAFLKVMGNPSEQSTGEHCPPALQPDSDWIANMKQVFQTGTPLDFKTSWHCAEGIRRFNVRLIPEFNRHNQIESILSIALDITSQEELEAELFRLECLNAVGEMAASIGHEVRNPMTTVRGYLQYYSSKEQFANYREAFHIMIDELDRANSIITDFLMLAKNKKVDMQRGNLGHVVRSLYPLLQADALCRGHELALELNDIPDRDFDEYEIRQLILNLVRNSFEAIAQGGKVIIRTYVNNGGVVLEVQDNGPGIPERVLAKLGTPFVTTKDCGTGLGLSMCFRIVERHGAKLNVNTGASGTVFCIAFI